MDTNFNEQKAFEDLQEILNRMYTIAGNFYSELQTAQNLNREKDETIAKLQREHEEALDKLTKSFDEELGNRRKEITALTNKLSEQEKIFTAHLKEYGDYNVKLTDRLSKIENDFILRNRDLDKRANKLSSDKQTLAEDRANLDKEREEFNREKDSTQKKLDAYEALQKQANNFDNEKQNLRNEYIGKIQTLEKEKSEAQEAIEQLEQDKKDLEAKFENIKKQRDELDAENFRLKKANNFGQSGFPLENNPQQNNYNGY